ncbi:MAG TPA: tetratricopeptide repeat protein [Thermoanaerobaculia bacterium]|nr:tetratricopeptide repeat protein [Thermoanaerobaculia bacterium]
MAESSISKRGKFAWAGLLVATCAVVYANGTVGAFTYDDKAIVRDNTRIRSPQTWKEIFTTPYFGGKRGTGSNYRPALLLSFAVEWWIHGKSALAFHVVNVALHAAVTLVLASLFLRIGIPPPATVAAALLFAVHPLHVEAVTSLVGRGEVQSALLTLLYLLCAVTWAGFGIRDSGFRRLPSLVIALVCYAGSVLTKESGAIAPALAVLLWTFLARGSLARRLGAAFARGWPFLLASAAVLLGVFRLRQWVLGGALRGVQTGIFELENVLAPLPAAARAVNACLIFFRYLGRCLFPLHLSADESAWSIRPLPLFSPWTLGAAILLLLLIAAALARLSSGPRSTQALGFLFFALALLPTGNLLFPIGTVFAERLAYLPSAGLCLAVGSLLCPGSLPAPDVGEGAAFPAARLRVLAAILAFLCVRTVVRNAVWWTDPGLFQNLVATAPQSAKAHYDLAYASADRGRDALARAEYGRAIALYHDYWDAWAGQGRVEKHMGLLDQAERSYETSVEIFPSYENGYFGLAEVREARGDDDGAEEAYRQGLEKAPASLPLAYHLALLSGRVGLPEADADWKRALELGGDLCSVRGDYARWLLGRGQSEAALGQARRILRRNPGCAEAWRVAARVAGDRGEAFAAGLALEKALRASHWEQDRVALTQVAQSSTAYARRFAELTRRGVLPHSPRRK